MTQAVTKKLKREKKESKKKRAKPSKDTLRSSERGMEKTKGDLRRIQFQHPVTDAGAGATASQRTIVLESRPQDVATRTGGLTKAVTGMANREMVRWFVEKVTNVEADWEELTPKQRVDGLLDPANAALEALGVPPLEASSQMPGMGDPTGAGFAKGGWTMSYGDEFSDFELDHKKFARAAGTIYHEARHAEQYFRVARKLAAEGKTAKDIERILLVSGRIAQEAVKVPLSEKQQDEWAQAEAWQRNLQKTDESGSLADTVNEGMAAAMNAYHESDENWKNYQYAVNGDRKVSAAFRAWYDNVMAQQGGQQKLEEFGKTLKENYINDREAFKQWYRFYGRMPVEEDAWAVGGLVEEELSGSAYTIEHVLADLSEDERTMTPVLLLNMSDMERRLRREILVQLQSQDNPPTQ
jgi:hypothetical protein